MTTLPACDVRRSVKRLSRDRPALARVRERTQGAQDSSGPEVADTHRRAGNRNAYSKV